MIIKNQCLHPISIPKVTGVTARILRCGQCPACLRQKQNEFAVRAIRQMQDRKPAFLSFTYDNEHCPIQFTKFRFDEDTGEYFIEKDIRRDSSFFQRAKYEIHYNKNGCPVKRYFPIFNEYTGALTYQYPSVYYEDLKLAIKRFRIKHPGVLTDFTIVPEYGSIGFRPHYHMLVYGLSETDINLLVSEWSFGHVDVDLCNNPLKDNNPRKISTYISKYATKGGYDCPYIKKGIVSKPRRSVSRSFGCGSEEDFKKLKDVLFCSDVTKIDDPFNEFDCDLSDNHLKLLLSRRSYMLDNYRYPLPKYLVNKIFKQSVKTITFYDSDRNKRTRSFKLPLSSLENSYFQSIKETCEVISVRYHQINSLLQKKISYLLFSDFASSICREQAKSSRLVEGSSLVSQFEADHFYPELSDRSYLSNNNWTDIYSEIDNDETYVLNACGEEFVRQMYNNSIF